MQINFNQSIKINREVNRYEWITSLCREKSIIDIGCNDTGMGGSPLHNAIKKVACKVRGVVGVDVVFDENFQGERHAVNLNGASLTTPPERLRTWDMIVAGEVIEHLENPSGLLNYILGSTPKEIIITAPNAFAPHRFTENRYVNGIFEEIVHPDHKSWYSPFTLKSTVEALLGNAYSILEIVLIDNQNSIGIHLISK